MTASLSPLASTPSPAVLVAGSVAYDTVLATPGRFSDTLTPEGLDHINLTFPTPVMRRSFGGCAANIAWAMLALGGRPVLWGALGADGGPYLERFKSWGADLSGLVVLQDCFSSQCFITTDADGNQIAAFHAGALDRADEAPMPEAGAKLAILAPGERRATLRQAERCLEARIPYLFDPGQATPLYGPEGLHTLVSGAFGVAFSDYEAELIERFTGLTPRMLAASGKTVWHTHGARGSSVWLPGADAPVSVPAAALPEGMTALDPVGAGDAYRGGLLWGLVEGADPVEAARVGAYAAAVKVTHRGSQDYALSRAEALALIGRSADGSGHSNSH